MTNIVRVQLQPAYVLHQRPYRDTSAIVDVFSEEYGRHSLVAKGLKRPKSKLRGLIQPFQPLLISWVGKTELGTLTDAELVHSVAMKSRYLPSAFYLNELLLKLLHRDDPHSDIFASYHNALEKFRLLSGQDEDELLWQAHLRCFEIELLQSLGYGLVLDHDVISQSSIVAEARYEYVLDRGPVLWSQDHSDQVAMTVSGNTLLALCDPPRLIAAAGEKDEKTRGVFKEAKRLLRSVIDYQLGNKSLHSRELFVNVSSRQRAASLSTLSIDDSNESEMNVQEAG